MRYANSSAPYTLEGAIKKNTILIQQTPASVKAHFNLDVHTNTELISISNEEHAVIIQSLDSTNMYSIFHNKLILA